MNTSLFELFKIGIGPLELPHRGPHARRPALPTRAHRPSSSTQTASLTVDLYGSLALTGIGHATDRAILMGLLEESP